MNKDEEIYEGKKTGYDSYLNLAFLLDSVNKFEPREEWIIPILDSRECADFKNQLLTAIEDYKQDNRNP